VPKDRIKAYAMASLLHGSSPVLASPPRGHNLPAAALLTFGEGWHGNHHAWPESARMGIEPGQHDPGWWTLLVLRRLGLVWGLRQPGDLAPRAGLRRVAAVPAGLRN
jgi:fatty-acid desaturase